MNVQLSIFHTNDMHGHLDAMARLSAFARRLRAQAQAEGRTVFFWDAGDAADRRVRLVSITKGAAFSPILNAMGYTLQTMGNDIMLSYGPQTMAAVAARARFPILAANCRDGDGPLPQGLHEYALVPLPNGLTMGVIGLTAPWDGLYQVFGLHFPDFCDMTRELVAKLSSQNVAPLIVLSHLGLRDDRRLAECVAGIDAIIGAHSHDLLPNGEIHNGVLIAQAGSFANALGRVNLTLDANGRVVTCAAQVLDVPPDELPDPAITAAVANAEREVAASMAQQIGVASAPFDLDYFHECGIGNLTADALREYMHAELAIVATGLLHRGLAAGAITFGDMDAVCFSGANPCVTLVPGAQLVATLERGLDPAITEVQHHGFRGAPVGILQISGMVVEYDPAAAVGARIKRVLVNDEPLDMNRLYALAHTDAETIPNVGFLVLEQEQKTEFEVPTIVREVIEAYLHRHSPVSPVSRGRWCTRIRSAAIILRGDSVALIERHRAGLVYYLFPGGQVEVSESFREAAAREVYEELGLRVEVQQLVAQVTFRGDLQYYFLSAISEGEFGTGTGTEMLGFQGPEHGTYTPIWMPISHLLEEPVRPRRVCQMIVDSLQKGWHSKAVKFEDLGSD